MAKVVGGGVGGACGGGGGLEGFAAPGSPGVVGPGVAVSAGEDEGVAVGSSGGESPLVEVVVEWGEQADGASLPGLGGFEVAERDGLF